MSENVDVSKRIRNIRKNLGMSMEEFGKLFDPVASKGVVSNWENNYNLPNNERLQRIAKLGDMTVDELLYGSTKEIVLKAMDDALNEFINSDSSLYLDYEDEKIRYEKLLDELSNEYVKEGNTDFSTADDFYKYIRNKTVRILGEEFLKGNRDDLNMITYLAYIVANAESDLKKYQTDPLTIQAIKDGDITKINVLEELLKDLDIWLVNLVKIVSKDNNS